MKRYIVNRKNWKPVIVLTILAIISFLFYHSLREPLFTTPTSTILEDREGNLLAARIAGDGQWRFPLCDSVPEKFQKAILAFEDEAFFSHPGFDLSALVASAYHNLRSGKTVRGGSTISMQVIRLSKNNPPRTYREKIVEIIQASRLELKYNKKEILRAYVSEAPFGGNVVGLEAAAWRYYGRPAWKLSWAESSLLAILPNAPTLMYPGKNESILLQKRNRLLRKLHLRGHIDSLSLQLALSEPLPGKPLPIPSFAPHLLDHGERFGLKGQKIRSTINSRLQSKVNDILTRHFHRLEGNEIFNAAALVLEVESGDVLAYCGNIPGNPVENKGYHVDIIQAPRSTGSILKPFLLAMLLDEGRYLPGSLVPDIPTFIGGYIPKNYYLGYDGAIPLKQMVSRSLNVPAVRLLHEYGIEKFHHNLRRMGMRTLSRPASHYGLSVILGGAEGSLWDMAAIYRGMAWKLNHYHLEKTGNKQSLYPVRWANKDDNNPINTKILPDVASIYQTFEAMNEVSRPEEDQAWTSYASSYKIAWKTGTSFGHRDGWAIGCTPRFVVAVWAGNASGEGRPGLTGIDAAAPLMFDIFKSLPASNWFVAPIGLMRKTSVCARSGYKSGEICQESDSAWVQASGINSAICPYHQWIFVDKKTGTRVTANCESTWNITRKSWFSLPATMEYYYKGKHPEYPLKPPYRQDCPPPRSERISFSIIYPQNNSKIIIPRELDGSLGRVIFEAVSAKGDEELFWYLNEHFLGKTSEFHQLGLYPSSGDHNLTLVNRIGETISVQFKILEPNR